jgi:hypothetical protein
MRTRVLTLISAALIPFAAASAQQEVAPRNVISLQPLSAVLTVYSAEYERQTSAAVTGGVGGTYWNLGDAGDDLTYKSADVKLRYYPNGTALRGFSVGGTVGFTSISGTSTTGADESASGPTLGVLLEYQWLMGVKRNFSLALGAGAKALMVKEENITSGDFTARYPTARVSVGYAF